MDLVNSERESVIESAIDTISAIGRDSTSRNSVWLHKQSEALGAAQAISGQKDQNGGVCNEVAEDSRNLHSDASSIYPDNNKFGSLQSTLNSEYRLLTPAMKNNLQRQDTFENTPINDNKNEFSEATTNTIGEATIKIYPETRMKAMSSNTGKSEELPAGTKTPALHVEENSKGTLHGHEITISELRPPKTLHSDEGRSTSSAAQAKKITFKGSYSCKIIRRERNAGIKLQRELQMRRKDQGSPKIVTLAQKKCHEMDPYSSEETLKDASLLEQMKRWLKIPKSGQGRNENFCETSENRKLTRNAKLDKQEDISPHRSVKFHSPSLCSEYNGSETADLAPSISLFASNVPTERSAGLPHTTSGEISDIVTYNCMKRSDVHRRIQDLKKLKRSKRKTMPISHNMSEFKSNCGQPFNADIAAEQTYRKGMPDRRRNDVKEKACNPRKFIEPSKTVKLKIHDEGNRFATSFDQSEPSSISHERIQTRHAVSKDALSNASTHSVESTTQAKISSISKIDASCGRDSYLTTGRHGLSYEISNDDFPTDSYSHKILGKNAGTNEMMRDKNVGTNDLESWTKNTPSHHDGIYENTNGNLYSQLWENLQGDGQTTEISKPTRPPNDDSRCRILYVDGYGNLTAVPHAVWIQLQRSLFRKLPTFRNQSPL